MDLQESRRQIDLTPIREQRVTPERRALPRWVERKNVQGIARDETGRVAA